MILAIESASTDPSVAVAAPDGTLLRLEGWSAAARQAHELLPRLLTALAEAGGTLPQVTGIGVGIGPGSFTGLRVGMSIGKGLAFALGVPIVGVPSLRAWLEAETEAAGAAARAGTNDAYLLARDEDEPRIVAREALPRDATLVAAAELAAAFELPHAMAPVRAAAAVALATAQRLAVDANGDDLERLEPRYLRQPRGVPAAAPADGR
jgi:tRNA threonylcarbamoyladenosine biosynthesis protein TsaB